MRASPAAGATSGGPLPDPGPLPGRPEPPLPDPPGPPVDPDPGGPGPTHPPVPDPAPM